MTFIDPQGRNRNSRVRQLAQSLMQQGSTPVYGAPGAIANVGRPILGALLNRRADTQEREQAQAETSAMGRLLAKAEEARRSGEDPIQAVNAMLAEEGSQSGIAEAGARFLSGYQQNLARALAQPPSAPERKILKDAAGRQRYADTGELVFPEAEAPAPKRTTLQKNLEAAGLRPGTPEYTRAIMESLKRPSTAVSVKSEGPIPPGYRAERDEAGNILAIEPIPGSPAAQEAAAATEAAAERQRQKGITADIVVQDIDRVLQLTDESMTPVTGLGAGTLANIPGTSAADAAALLDTVRANIGFDKLQSMRESSPTGGALGQVSERENQLLQSTFGSLSQSQSEDQFKRNLKRLRETYLDIVHGKGQGPGRAPDLPVAEYRDQIVRSPFGERWMVQDDEWVRVE